MKMEDHLTVKKLREAGGLELTLDERKSLTALDLRGLARACGAHDGGGASRLAAPCSSRSGRRYFIIIRGPAHL